MCMLCWVTYGRPQINNETTRQAAKAIHDVYQYDDSGGGLHVILDDWNLEDEYMERYNGHDEIYKLATDFDKQLKAEEYCLSLLKSMTIEERASSLALRECFFT